MSMFSNSVDKILKAANFVIADLEQHAKNMLRDVAVHSETIAHATEQKLKASAEHQRAMILAARFKTLLTAEPLATPQGILGQKQSSTTPQNVATSAKRPM